MNLTTRRFLLLALSVAVAGAALFSLGLGGSFVLDDAHTIVDNPLIQITALNGDSLLYAAASFGGARPLAMLSFALDYWRHGSLDAATFKATNLTIHAMTTFGLALFLRKLLLLAQWPVQHAATVALVLALLWAVHPLQVSAVLYVVQRMQTMASLYLVWALWAYICLRQAQIEDRPGWPFGLLSAALWLLALLSKEDAVMLPAYFLLLELTVLRFRAAQDFRARSLRHTYLLMTVIGTATFVLWALPHYWVWDAYPGRDFNSLERLLTQARVLAIYLGQIVFPLPSLMPFNYDTFVPSRSLLQPLTTLVSLLLMAGLLAWAWLWRTRRPVFALGVLLFFAGHFVTSNVIGLELIFEHRNHLPLVGILLALADLALWAKEHWRIPSRAWIALVCCCVLLVGAAGGLRAHAWGEPIRFARYSVDVAPDSPRAWLVLGGTYFDLAGRRHGKDNPYLTQAIEALEEATTKIDSPSVLSNIVIYKSIQGNVTPADWGRLLAHLDQAPMTPATRNIAWTTLKNLQAGIPLDPDQALRVIEAIVQRAEFTSAEYQKIGTTLYTKTSRPDRALHYFLRAAETSPPGTVSVLGLATDLRNQGREDWAQAIEQANATSHER